jgi:hypothetical protein
MKTRLSHALALTVALSGAAVLGLGCGGSEPEPKTAADHDDDDDPEPRKRRRGKSIEMGGELGAIDERKADEIFASLLPAFERCLKQGAEQVEFLGGAVNFFVKVDLEGNVHSHLEESTLGDRETERCMLGAIRKKTWPKPVGGEVGYARKSFDFDPPNDVRAPEEWPSDRATDALEKISSKIASCKDGVRGKFGATMYVDTDGKVLAVGVTPPDETGEESVDCLVGVLKDAKMPSPGSWPAKVSFQL